MRTAVTASTDNPIALGNDGHWQRESTGRPRTACWLIFAANLLPTELLYDAAANRKLEMAGAYWVHEERFLGCQVDPELLTERVRRGSHTLLVADRRMGKTSLVRESLRQLRETGHFDTFYVDVEAAEDHRHAVAEIGSCCPGTEGMKARVSRILGGALERVDELSVFDLSVKLRARIDDSNWQHRADEAFEGIASYGRPAVLAIDELPILVNRLLKGPDYAITPERRARTDQFLSWLRKNAQRHQRRVSLVLTGSVGLELILRQANLSSLANAYEPYSLPPWTVAEASGCLEALARQYGLTLEASVRQGSCDRLRCCIPHHVQQFFSHLHHHLRLRRRTKATMEDVASVYSQRMLGVEGQVHLEHYEGRLRAILGAERYELALEILTETACAGRPLTVQAIELFRGYTEHSLGLPKSTVSDVLRVLEHDGYLHGLDGAYGFVSGLLEDWWRRRHCSQHVSLADRANSGV